VPWMVGITSREGGLFPICEIIFLHKINCYIFLIMQSNLSSLLKRHAIRACPELLQSTADQYRIFLDPLSSLVSQIPCLHYIFPQWRSVTIPKALSISRYSLTVEDIFRTGHLHKTELKLFKIKNERRRKYKPRRKLSAIAKPTFNLLHYIFS
jgi:hypothetical protein